MTRRTEPMQTARATRPGAARAIAVAVAAGLAGLAFTSAGACEWHAAGDWSRHGEFASPIGGQNWYVAAMAELERQAAERARAEAAVARGELPPALSDPRLPKFSTAAETALAAARARMPPKPTDLPPPPEWYAPPEPATAAAPEQP